MSPSEPLAAHGCPHDLTVVVTTAHPDAALDHLMRVLLPQLALVRGQLILADGSAEGVPTPAHDDVVVDHLRRPGLDVFALRALATKSALGWVVAFTEDHCLPTDDWALQILQAHRVHGQAAAISGATRNGSPDLLVDRANFLVTFAPVLPPLPPALHGRVPPPNNISIKREALEGYELPPGFLEFELVPHLARTGHVGLADAVLVRHVQSHGAWHAVALHFHNGRTTAGLLGRRGGPRSFAIAAGRSVTLVPRHLAQTLREIWRRPQERRSALPAVPWCAVLLTAHATGQLVGLARGPGSSPSALD